MTPTEFKAWFTGYAENIPVSPNPTQWNRIVEIVEKMKDKPVKLTTVEPTKIVYKDDAFIVPFKATY